MNIIISVCETQCCSQSMATAGQEGSKEMEREEELRTEKKEERRQREQVARALGDRCSVGYTRTPGWLAAGQHQASCKDLTTSL